MALNATLGMREETAIIVLDGDLDAATAPILQEKVERAAEHNPNRLVFDMT